MIFSIADDYLQFHGGMIATIRNLTGQQPKHYFGDSAKSGKTGPRDLRKEEILRVFRSRVVNPKWLEGIRKHGYKGGLQIDRDGRLCFGYDATANVAEDWMYEKLTETYALDPVMQAFFEQNNPWHCMPLQNGCWKLPSGECGKNLLNMHCWDCRNYI